MKFSLSGLNRSRSPEMRSVAVQMKQPSSGFIYLFIYLFIGLSFSILIDWSEFV